MKLALLTYTLIILTLVLPIHSAPAYDTNAVDDYFNRSVAERYGLTGSASARARYQENSSGIKTHSRIQIKGQIEAYVLLNESGCLKARTQVTTGPKFDSTWDESGIGNADRDININFRRLYLDMNCYLKLAVQMGAIPPHSIGDLGIKEDGWVDGLRVAFYLDQTKNIRVAITAGDVDEYTTPNLFKRDWDGSNYYQLSVDGKISQNLNFVADFTEHDENEYFRTGLKLAIKDITRILDSVSIENVLANGHQQALMISVERQLGKWKLKLSQTNMREAQLEEGTLALPIEDFYGKDHNYQVTASRNLGKKWVLRLRARDGNAGPRVEVRIDYKF